MGDFLDKVLQRRYSAEALAHRIVLRQVVIYRTAIVTEAGDDSFFYGALAVRLRRSADFEFFEANGRSKVIETLMVLHDLSKLERAFGIVDRDFNSEDDELICFDHCLVLDTYSYENYFWNRETLVEIGQRFFALEPGGEQFDEWQRLVEMFLGSLSTALKREHAIALWCKLNKKNCNLNQFRVLAHLNILSDGSLSRNNDLESRFVDESKADIAHVNSQDLISCEETLSEIGWHRVLRGHYFWTLFTGLLKSFRKNIDLQNIMNNKNRTRTRAEITSRHALESSIHFLKMPEIVACFLNKIK